MPSGPVRHLVCRGWVCTPQLTLTEPLGVLCQSLVLPKFPFVFCKNVAARGQGRGWNLTMPLCVPLQLFWTYIQAMLTNLESLSLERIHSMLKMFVMTGPVVTEIDIQELQGFLQKKVRDQQLIYSGGVYRLPKNCS